MITVEDLSVQFGKRILFDEVNLKFTQGNCYGVIGANGAGKSTFLKVLAGDIDPTRGHISVESGQRMAVLRQNHFEFEEKEVLDTVIMGHKEMYDIMVEKNAIYMNPDATEAEGLRAAELENQFGEMGGWEAESEAAGLLSVMGIKEDLHYKQMKELTGSQKVKVLLAQALFGSPDILILDEPTNDLDPETAIWLADFLADYRNMVLCVSHDRYFLDMISTHTVDIDFKKIKIFTGNYSFWYQSSQLLAQQIAQKNKKMEQKRKEMMEFIQRFSANASKSKQATSRKKALDKLTLEDLKPSSRKYPFIHFKPEREPGDQLLRIENLSAVNDNGDYFFKDFNLIMNKGEKVALISRDSSVTTAFYEVVMGNHKAHTGTIEFGQTITPEYLPNDNLDYFSRENDLELMDWLRQYSEEKDEQFVRGFLGRMLFSGEEVYKKVSVLSGGEKVRCMLSKIMLKHPNFLLLDEPTNHLDLESITALNNAMKEFPSNIIFTTHDHELNQTVANRIIEISPNGMIDRLIDYDDYMKSEEIRAMREELYKGVVFEEV